MADSLPGHIDNKIENKEWKMFPISFLLQKIFYEYDLHVSIYYDLMCKCEMSAQTILMQI